MRPILSRQRPRFDNSAAGLSGSARDLGEAVAYLAGGVPPDAEALSRLCLSLRALQGFLIDEADQQEGREAIAADETLRAMIAAVSLPRPPYAGTAVTRAAQPEGVSA